MTRYSSPRAELTGLLADTWWYGLSHRVSEEAFLELACLRVEQGFSAIQLVAGIPPEVGPEHPYAASEVGPAWTLAGTYNQRYLQLAARRTAMLNQLGLRVILYGAWGHQIKWLGRAGIVGWWQELVNQCDALDVIYCLTGESNLWIGQENGLLPDKSTGDLWQRKVIPGAETKIASLVKRSLRRINLGLRKRDDSLLLQRRQDWSYVLEALHKMTSRPLIIHTNANELGYQVVENPALLAANTTQTGHSETMRDALWQIPLGEMQREPEQIFINLEPWYEGINDSFYVRDQLFAYWVTMLAGAASYCYGAQGIWNVGDGRFLSHWGKQTFSQAMQFESPRLLGLSHQLFLKYQGPGDTIVVQQDGKLLSITKKSGSKSISFYPYIAGIEDLPGGQIWLPLDGGFTDELPQSGPVVLIDS